MPSQPNIKRLARRKRLDALAAALDYHDWAQLRDGRYVDLGIPVRRDAVAALGESEDPRAADAIARGLTDGALAVRMSAIAALERRLDSFVASALAHAYLSADATGDTTTRSAALNALCSEPHATAAPVVRTLLEQNGKGNFDESELELLRALAASSTEGAHVTVAALVAALDDEDPAARERALKALVGLGPKSVPALIAAMDDDRRRPQAAIALGRCGDGRAVEALIGLLVNPDPAVRRAAAGTLGDLRDPTAVGPLIAAAQDRNHETRVAAASALDRLGSAGLIVELAAISRQSTSERTHAIPATPAEARGVPTPMLPRTGSGASAQQLEGIEMRADGVVEDASPHDGTRGGTGVDRVRRRPGARGRLRALAATVAVALTDVAEHGSNPPILRPGEGTGAAKADSSFADTEPASGWMHDVPAEPSPSSAETEFEPDSGPREPNPNPERSSPDGNEIASDVSQAAGSSDVSMRQKRVDQRSPARVRSRLLVALCLAVVAVGAGFAVTIAGATHAPNHRLVPPHRPLSVVPTSRAPAVESRIARTPVRRHARAHHPTGKKAVATAARPVGGVAPPSRYIAPAVRAIIPAGARPATPPPSGATPRTPTPDAAPSGSRTSRPIGSTPSAPGTNGASGGSPSGPGSSTGGAGIGIASGHG